ncbi:MAG TPA: PHB depolymerase family esterase [Kiritimatiellia bacterium]|jgi:polyhydroxybutyrate depolymerase
MSARDHVIYLDSRRYVVHLPPAFSASAQPALVVMMDGRGGTPWTAIKSSGWSPKADEQHFVVAYPEAEKVNPAGPQHFLDNPQMWKTEHGSGDVAYLLAVLDDVHARFNTDPARVYLAGFSNGAVMACRFALDQPERVAAIGHVAANFRTREPTLRRLVPMICFFGKQDPIAPYTGGTVTLPWGLTEQRPDTRETPALWARLLGIADAPHVDERPDGVTVTSYGKDVVCYAVDGLGHVWPGGHRLLPEKLVGASCEKVRATDMMWDFFRVRSCS